MTGALGVTAAALGAAAPAAAAASMSRLMMRPFGPEPCTLWRSSPRSLARRRANGDERTSPVGGWMLPPEGAGAAGPPPGEAGGVAATFRCRRVLALPCRFPAPTGL